MAKPKRKIPAFVIGIWAANIFLGIALVAGVLLWRRDDPLRAQPKLASAAQAESLPEASAANPAPGEPATPYILSSVTPNPHSTLVVGATPTPFTLILDTHHAQAMVIGYSVLRRPLEVYRFGHGEDEKLIVAGIHGGYEWNTVALADELIAYISNNPEVIPSDVTLYILRNLNPDGEARSHGYEGRTNERNVDLNHNFPYRWEKEWNRDGCWNYLPTTGGTHPASEPETIALINFINLHDFSALISYHSAALGIFAGGVPLYEPSDRLAKTLGEISPYAYPPFQTGCDYSGNLADWASSVKGIPAVDIELTNHRDTDFDANLRILKAFLAWDE